MTQHSYLIHRAAKRSTPSPLELALLDRDLAEAGVCIPRHETLRADAHVKSLIDRAVKAALRAA
jgi:hypothetical protein